LIVAVEGATVVREHQGIYYNVLVYKKHCGACGYGAPKNFFAVAALPCDTYDIRCFACTSCDNRQAVRIRFEIGEEVAALLLTE
jgi:ribosomal protein L37E